MKWGQLKFYKVGNKKGSLKKKKTSNNRSRVFEIALERGRERKGGGNVNFTWESFNLQCFCHAKGNIQQTLISQNSMTCVDKARNLKYKRTEMLQLQMKIA